MRFTGLSKKTGIILLVLGSLAGGTILLLSKPIPSAPVRPATPPSAPGPDAAFQGVHLVEAKGGKMVWEVEADQVEFTEEGGLVKAKVVREPVSVTFYTDNDRIMAKAGEALLNMRTKDVTLKGKVRAVSGKGAALETESLSWLAEKKKLFAHQEILLISGGLMTRAQGMEAEPSLERVKLFGRVESKVWLQNRFPGDRKALLMAPQGDRGQEEMTPRARGTKRRARR